MKIFSKVLMVVMGLLAIGALVFLMHSCEQFICVDLDICRKPFG